MIKLKDAELISLLPPCIKNNADVQAISYAYRMAMKNIFQYSRWVMLYANIDEIPDRILDLLALETRAQYYEESMKTEVKRDIIRKTIAWYVMGGTVYAVEEMARTVFGEGNVVEWYQFGGVPGEFYIETSEEFSPDIVRRFNEIIDKVKNKRAKLTKVEVKRRSRQNTYLAAHSRGYFHVVLHDDGLNKVWIRQSVAMHSRRTGRIAISDRKMREENERNGGKICLAMP